MSHSSNGQEQYIELQEDLIAIAETIKKVSENRQKIVVSECSGCLPLWPRRAHEAFSLAWQCERGEQKVMSVLKFIHDKIVHPIKVITAAPPTCRRPLLSTLTWRNCWLSLLGASQLLLKDRDRAFKKYNAMKTKIGGRQAPLLMPWMGLPLRYGGGLPPWQPRATLGRS